VPDQEGQEKDGDGEKDADQPDQPIQLVVPKFPVAIAQYETQSGKSAVCELKGILPRMVRGHSGLPKIYPGCGVRSTKVVHQICHRAEIQQDVREEQY
jgi:hypothetical protein